MTYGDYELTVTGSIKCYMNADSLEILMARAKEQKEEAEAYQNSTQYLRSQHAMEWIALEASSFIGGEFRGVAIPLALTGWVVTTLARHVVKN